jgi:hypothetical protein
MNLSESTKKGLRTIYQAIPALAVAIPVLLATLPTNWVRITTIGASVAGAIAVAVKIINALEDKGVIPAFLRDVDTTTVTKTTTVAVDASDEQVDPKLLDYGHAEAGGISLIAVVLIVLLLIWIL